VRDEAAVADAITGAEVVFHLAASVGTSGPSITHHDAEIMSSDPGFGGFAGGSEDRHLPPASW
jgi:hypothetical protein